MSDDVAMCQTYRDVPVAKDYFGGELASVHPPAPRAPDRSLTKWYSRVPCSAAHSRRSARREAMR
jgi:hypothetical protein